MFKNKVVWLIYGTRKFSDITLFNKVLDSQLPKIIEQEKAKNPNFEVSTDLIVLDGGALGPDTYANDYAKSNGLKWKRMKANWKHPGSGMERNSEMVAIADYATGFWNGVSGGTQDSMIKVGKKGIPSFTFIYPAFLCEGRSDVKWYVTGKITKQRYLKLRKKYNKFVEKGLVVTLISDGLEHSTKMDLLAKKLGTKVFNLGSTVGGLFALTDTTVISRCLLHSTHVSALPPMEASVLLAKKEMENS